MIYCGNDKTSVGEQLEGATANTVAEIRERRTSEAYRAAYRGSLYYLKGFLDDGDINANDRPSGVSSTLLMAASESWNPDKIDYLISKGARVNEQDSMGLTALVHAVVSGSEDVTRSLLGHGAQVELRDRLGRTALMHAVRAGYVGAVEALLEAGADPFAVNKDGSTMEDQAEQGKKVFQKLLRKLEKEIEEGKGDLDYCEFLRSEDGPKHGMVLRLVKKYRSRTKLAA